MSPLFAFLAALSLSAVEARLGDVDGRALLADTGFCCFSGGCEGCGTPSASGSWCSTDEATCQTTCGGNAGSAVWCPTKGKTAAPTPAGGSTPATTPAGGSTDGQCCLSTLDGNCQVYESAGRWCAESKAQCVTCSGGLATWSATSVQPAPLKDIVDTAISAGTFTTLVAAVAAVGLVDTLKSAGPFTVFAPTDDAFALLPTGTVESLLLPENKAKLAGILTYHVLNGAVDASTAISLDGADVPTINGATLRVSVVNGALFVNDAQVIVADVLASNGIIHVIDAVLMPPAL